MPQRQRYSVNWEANVYQGCLIHRPLEMVVALALVEILLEIVRMAGRVVGKDEPLTSGCCTMAFFRSSIGSIISYDVQFE